MKTLLAKWNSIGLIWRIVIGLVIGAVLGVCAGGIEVITLLGTLFVGALRAVAPVLVFFLVISSLAHAKADGSMKTVVLLYLLCTFSAAVVAVLASYLFPVHLTLAGVEAVDQASPEGLGSVMQNLVLSLVANPVGAVLEANYLGILVWAIVFGIALRAASAGTKEVFKNVADAISKVVGWIIQLAPFGVLGLVYNAVSTSGLEIFTEYGTLLLVLVGCMLVMALVVNPLLVFIELRCNPYPLVLRCLKDSGITAFFTRSSAANIPVNLDLCRRLQVNKDIYSVSIPLGATINMAGAAVTITVMTMATCATLGISVSIPTAVMLSLLATASACGASGVAGGSLLLIPMACSLFGIPGEIAMQVVGIGFIIGVVQDSFETALNSSSDALFTTVADYHARIKAGEKVPIAQLVRQKPEL